MSRALRVSLVALTTAALASFAPLASASRWNSGFDPIASITFSGNALFQFDDVCLASDGFHDAATCNLEMLSAEVDLTDTSTSDTAHLSFAPIVPWFVTGNLLISGGDLVGLNTDQIGAAFISGDGSLNGPWWIQWTTASGIALADPVSLFSGSCSEGCFPDTFPIAEALNVTFTRVPEPGTLGLVLGGAGVAWVARRRKRAA